MPCVCLLRLVIGFGFQAHLSRVFSVTQLYTVNRISSRISLKHVHTSECGSFEFFGIFLKVVTRPANKPTLHSAQSTLANKHSNKVSPLLFFFCLFVFLVACTAKANPKLFGQLVPAQACVESVRVLLDRPLKLSSLMWCQLLTAENLRLVSEEAGLDVESVTE